MHRPKIMIVEDEIVVAMELEEKLRAMGYEVAAIVSSGEDAVSDIEVSRPDLVLMDIRLQGEIDGIQAAEQIRRRHNVPVIYLTAYADDATLQRAKITEPYGYLVKPFSETELHTNIEVALYKHAEENKVNQSARWMTRTIDVLGAGLIVTDQDGIIKYINHAAETLTGWARADASGEHFTKVYVLRNRQTGGIVANPVPMPLKEGAIAASSKEVLVSKNDVEIQIESFVMPVTDSDGEFGGITLTFQEVAQRAWEDQDWFSHAANLYLTAALCFADGEYAKAESFFKRTLMIFEKNLGSDHPKVANVLKDLAELKKRTKKVESENQPAVECQGAEEN
jgi:PAS domain S-box-containing protein